MTDISSITGVTDYLLKKLSLYNKPNHVLYLYDNIDNVLMPNLNQNDVKTIERLEPFKDQLNQKYEYYEYLYFKIPSLKIIIDILVEQILVNGYSFYPENREDYSEYELKKIDENIKQIWTKSKLTQMIKIQQIYGEVYLKINSNYTSKKCTKYLKILNPKYIRPIYKNKKLKGYVTCVDGKRHFFRKNQIYHIKNISYIEKYIYFLDIAYSEITNSIERPTLLWDEIHDCEKFIQENIHSKEKCIKKLLDSCKIIKKLYNGNNIYTESNLYFSIGCCYFTIKNFDEAITYYENIIKITKNARSSDLLELKQEAIKMRDDSLYFKNHIEETM